MRYARVIAAVALAAAVGPGCGYTTRSSLDPQYRSIHIAGFQNESREYDLQAPLTTALIRRFVNDGRLRVVGRANADLILEGVIRDYGVKGTISDAQDEPTQFVNTIVVDVRLIDGRTNAELWHDPKLGTSTRYTTRASLGPSDRLRGNEQVFTPVVRSFLTAEENMAASESLASLASDIFYRTVEPW